MQKDGIGKVSLVIFFISLLMSSYANSDKTNDSDSTKISILDVQAFKKNTWEEIRFKGLTDYQLVTQKSENYLRAESRKSASGLLFKKDIDLSKTPYINWSWSLEKGLAELPETIKPGDDYSARIYLIHSGGWFFWQTKALNYVWSSRKAKETTWQNAYAPDNAMMKAVRDQSDEMGIWYTEKRNIQADFKEWLGEDISQIEGVAIMTDTDDSNGHAVVYYGNIYFSAD